MEDKAHHNTTYARQYLIDRSENKDVDRYAQEWGIESIRRLVEWDKCTCGARIHYAFVVRNRITGAAATLGSTCVMHVVAPEATRAKAIVSMIVAMREKPGMVLNKMRVEMCRTFQLMTEADAERYNKKRTDIGKAIRTQCDVELVLFHRYVHARALSIIMNIRSTCDLCGAAREMRLDTVHGKIEWVCPTDDSRRDVDANALIPAAHVLNVQRCACGSVARRGVDITDNFYDSCPNQTCSYYHFNDATRHVPEPDGVECEHGPTRVCYYKKVDRFFRGCPNYAPHGVYCRKLDTPEEWNDTCRYVAPERPRKKPRLARVNE